MDTRIARLDADDFREALPEALAVYVAAMGYPPQVMRSRAPAWSEHARRPGWGGVAAYSGTGRRRVLGRQRPALVGICYGYTGSAGQWWFEEVARGLRERGDAPLEADYVELTELHVAPEHQGRGLGTELLRAFLDGRPERRVLLSTPEIDGERNGAWRLYRSLGFTDVLRDFRFSGDPRSFAVLGRGLPLPATAPRTPPSAEAGA